MKKYIYTAGIFLVTIMMGCEIIDENTYRTVDQMIGEYEVDEWSETLGAQSYFDIYIAGDKRNRDLVYLENFYNAGITIFAEVNGSKIRIPIQEVDFYEVEGMGSFYEGELTMTYSVRDIDYQTKIVDVCNAICYKKW